MRGTKPGQPELKKWLASIGANLERVKEQRNGLTTYEVDKLYEEESNGNWRLYIGKVAIINYDATSKHQLRYTHQDRLGSSLTYTDHNGQVTDRRMFDAFGKPRATDGNNLAVPKLQNPLLSRNGFTDHRHLDEVELIHMNGRAYDYNLGRFLSVDPIIQSPGNSQSLNPYSYIMNNPLAGTDPTGYCVAETGTRTKKCVDVEVTNTDTGETSTKSVNLMHSNAGNHIISHVATSLGNGAQITGISATFTNGKTTDLFSQGSVATAGRQIGAVGTSAATQAGASSSSTLLNGAKFLGGMGLRLLSNIAGILLPMNETGPHVGEMPPISMEGMSESATGGPGMEPDDGEVQIKLIRQDGSGKNARRTYEVDGTRVDVNTGHGFYRAHKTGSFSDTSLSVNQTEFSIVKDLGNYVRAGGNVPNARPGMPNFDRSIIVNNVEVGYRAANVNGNIRIVSYWPKL